MRSRKADERTRVRRFEGVRWIAVIAIGLRQCLLAMKSSYLITWHGANGVDVDHACPKIETCEPRVSNCLSPSELCPPRIQKKNSCIYLRMYVGSYTNSYRRQ